ncbi:MAG: lysophospholipase [Pseudomonadota bacterium]
MQHHEGDFIGARDLTIYYQYWLPEADARALVIVAHGAAEHGGRYAGLAERLTASGYAVAALDHPGHGRSEGTPGFIERFDDYVQTLRRFQLELGGIAQGAPRILLGHSMGGLIACCYLLEYQSDLAGCVLSGPAISTELQPSWFQLLMIRLLSVAMPKSGALQLDAGGVSKDPEVVAAYRADPLVYTGKLSARWVAELFRAMQSVQERASEITLPLLLQHGSADSMTAPAGSELLYRSVSSDDKSLKLYADLYHEIFNEPERDIVIADLQEWLEGQLTR